MGRKYANKIKWKKARKIEYDSRYREDDDFRGYLAYIRFLEVEEALRKTYFGQEMVMADQGYVWLQVFPLDKNYCITAKYDDQRRLVKWYIDIVAGVGLDQGVPYMLDMYLDLDILPSGEIEILDRDELDQAREEGRISARDYQASLAALDNFIENLDLEELEAFCKESLDSFDLY